MTEDHSAKLDELERILNDPTVPMHAARVWALVDEVARAELSEG